MEFTAKQIADMVSGELEGNPEIKVNNLSKIEKGLPMTLSFLANPKYTSYIYNTKASIVIVKSDFTPDKPLKHNPTLIKVDDPYACFAQLLEAYNQVKYNKTGIANNAEISESAEIGEDVYIGAFAYIGDRVKIGKEVKIFPNSYIGDNVVIEDNSIIHTGCKIMNDCRIGKTCILHPNVVIGSDGFGFAPNSKNNYSKIAQIGNVIIEDFVEIGANSTIDRATLGSTIIRNGVKLDNLVQVAHNVEIGENTVIAAQTGIAGSSKIGKNCMIGGQVGIVGHIKIGDGVKISAQSGITNSVAANETVFGSPAINAKEYKRAYIAFRKMPEYIKKINKIDENLNQKN